MPFVVSVFRNGQVERGLSSLEAQPRAIAPLSLSRVTSATLVAAMGTSTPSPFLKQRDILSVMLKVTLHHSSVDIIYG